MAEELEARVRIIGIFYTGRRWREKKPADLQLRILFLLKCCSSSYIACGMNPDPRSSKANSTVEFARSRPLCWSFIFLFFWYLFFIFFVFLQKNTDHRWIDIGGRSRAVGSNFTVEFRAGLLPPNQTQPKWASGAADLVLVRQIKTGGWG